ncbi:S1C family serine protease [Paradesertivirga mongoliensis]|uniref:S1C family serine protease n=1 Tax=Paradesertivirga mongoliensis TaxID=2100740 RepID=A0ABW4ZLD1_9SPHI|nr:serine protease [Pedobacter mongoliensis]
MELTERIEAYLNGEMSGAELEAFESLRATNPALDQQIVAHQAFITTLTNYGKKKKLMSDMNAIHETLDVQSIKADVIPASTLVRMLWNKYRVNAAVAASVAILAVFTSLLLTGYFSHNATKSDMNLLRRQVSRELGEVKKDQKEILRNMEAPVNPGIFGGTGFALTANGYVVTNSHVIKGADSIYIQNGKGDSYKVNVVYDDPAFDLAILKINDADFETFGSIPYSIRKAQSDVSENVFTVGFPKDDHVLGKGYLSSASGYKGDTTEYQVDITVNNGNSGGPLLDNRGNVIGVIKGKQSLADGTGFAVKSKYILAAVDSLQNTSDAQIVLNKKNQLAGLSSADQYKKLKNYVFMVKVY